MRCAGSSIGPSTQSEPYLVSLTKGVSIVSLLTAGDSVPLTTNLTQEYKLVGVPDGMGAYLTPNTPDLEFTKNCRYSPQLTINNHSVPTASRLFDYCSDTLLSTTTQPDGAWHVLGYERFVAQYCVPY